MAWDMRGTGKWDGYGKAPKGWARPLKSVPWDSKTPQRAECSIYGDEPFSSPFDIDGRTVILA